MIRIWRFLMHPGERLFRRTMHGGVWIFGLRLSNRLLQFILTVVLARLLEPDDFGLFGIALLSLMTLESLTQTGFDLALIQKDGDIRPYLDSAWTIQILRGLLIAAVLLLGAPLVVMFFQEPRAVFLVRLLSLIILMNSLNNIGIVFYRKELQFHKHFIYRFSGTVANLLAAIPAAFILRSVWALVLGYLAASLARLVASYILHPYRPKIRLDRHRSKELYSFGKWIFASSIVGFIALHGDDVFLGKFLGAAALGLYLVAFQLSNLTATEVTQMISQVTFPAYSKLQKSIPRLQDAYLKTLELIVLISVPAGIGIFLLGPEFTRIFLGEKWLPMIPALRVLALSGLVRSVQATIGPLNQAMGRPYLNFRLNLLRIVTMAVVIYPLTKSYGLEGTAVAVLVSILMTMPLWMHDLVKNLHVRVRQVSRKFVLPSAGGGVMGFVILALNHLLRLNSWTFLLVVILALMGYLIVPVYLWRKSGVVPFESLDEIKKSL